MQKNVSTVLVAFLAGIVVAGGGVYLVTSVGHGRPPQPEAQVAQQAAPATEAEQPAAPDQQAASEVSSRAAPAAEVAATKPSPIPERRRQGRTARAAAKAQAAHEVSEQDTVARTLAPAEPVAPAQPAPEPVASVPAPSQPVLNPPSGTQTAPPPPRTPKTISLTPGTPVAVRLNETISTDHNYPGDTFTASLDKAIVVDGFVIADRGSRVIGKVITAERSGRVKGTSDLTIALTQIHTTDGQTVNIETTPWNKQGQQTKKRDGAEIAGGAALGAIIGAIAGGGKGAAIGAGSGGAAGTGVVLTQRGKEATFPAETRLTFTLQAPVSITERL